jgi:hypothetical protein
VADGTSEPLFLLSHDPGLRHLSLRELCEHYGVPYPPGPRDKNGKLVEDAPDDTLTAGEG